MMKHKILAAITGVCLTNMVSASDVADFFSDLNTFSANFSQTVVQDNQLVQQSVGQVKLKKPLKFRWDYQTPEAMQLLSDGKRFYHYDIDLAQATSKPVEEVAGTAIATLLDDTRKIDETFIVKSLTATALLEQYPEQAHEWLKHADVFYALTPKDKSTDDLQATRALVGISKTRQLAVFFAEDAYGENTFLFDKISQNTDLSDSLFIFSPPAGVDVLGE